MLSQHNEVSRAHMVLSSQALSLRLLHSNQEVRTLGDPMEGGRQRGGGKKGGREGRRKGKREGYMTCFVCRLPQPKIFAVECNDFFFILYWFTGNDPANEETSNSTQANFKGFPGTDGLMSPPKDMKVNPLLNFWGRAECPQKRNKSLLQVGLELQTFRSAFIIKLEQRKPGGDLLVVIVPYPLGFKL